METVLRGFSYESYLMYLDNVIVIGRTFQEHLLKLWKVFQRFREARVNLNPDKCQLFQKGVRYFRHIVSPEKITTDPEKLKAIRKWPSPKNKPEIRSFLGLYTYSMRCISGFANIANPLIDSRGRYKPSSGLQKWSPPSKHSALPLFLLTRSQKRGSS
jgi:hypothetical protein